MKGESAKIIAHKSGCSEKKTPYISQVSRSYLQTVNKSTTIRHKPACSPICTTENRTSTGHRVRLTSIRLHADPARVLEAQQIIHDFKPLVFLGIVDRRDIDDALELALGVVAEEGEDGDDARGADVQGELVLEDGELLHEAREGLHYVGAVVVQRFSCLCMAGDGWVGGRRLCEGRRGSWLGG